MTPQTAAHPPRYISLCFDGQQTMDEEPVQRQPLFPSSFARPNECDFSR
jgi:hypothetical protein